MITLHEILSATATSAQVYVKLFDHETNEDKVKVRTRRDMIGSAGDVLDRLIVMARDDDKSLDYIAYIDGNIGGEIHISAEPMKKHKYCVSGQAGNGKGPDV